MLDFVADLLHKRRTANETARETYTRLVLISGRDGKLSPADAGKLTAAAEVLNITLEQLATDTEASIAYHAAKRVAAEVETRRTTWRTAKQTAASWAAETDRLLKDLRSKRAVEGDEAERARSLSHAALGESETAASHVAGFERGSFGTQFLGLKAPPVPMQAAEPITVLYQNDPVNYSPSDPMFSKD